MSDGSGPPVLIGERVWWLGSGSGLPKQGLVRWIGRLPEIGPDWALGIELEESLPYGGVDGTWRGRQLFRCKPRHGLIVPSDRVLAHHSHGGAGLVDVPNRKDVSLLPLHNQVSAPPRLRRSHQDRSLLLDRHSDFRSVHLEAVQIRRRIQEDRVVSLVLGQSAQYAEDAVLSRGMTGREAVVPRPRRTESLAARKEKSNSGLFSFLRWFRRDNRSDRGDLRSSFSSPGSPVLSRADSAVTGSVDTLFSTATATSFAYVRPEVYNPFDEPEKWIFPGPETHTYRNRIKRRDELRRLNQNLSLREKYNLYASGSLGRSLDEIFDDSSHESLDRLERVRSCSSTLARKKRQAPPPPLSPPPPPPQDSPGCDSLPTTLSKESLDDFKLHRRTLSESAKYKKKAYHVKGKRKAPPPPRPAPPGLEEQDGTETSRKKRRAPPPPVQVHKGPVVNIPKEAALDVIDNEKIRSPNSNGSARLASSSKAPGTEVESVSSTDTLRLERGLLTPNNMDKGFVQHKAAPAPTSPVSPRPWYKRPQSVGPQSAANAKQNESKKKENKSIEDWMLESGFPRRSQALPTDSKFTVFNKGDRPEDKRRSQISILTNISELDREAAEIIQRGKEREKSLLASYNAKYYVEDGEDVESSGLTDEASQTEPVAKKPTAKELISLFNSITNVTRVTLNSHFLPKDDPSRNTTSALAPAPTSDADKDTSIGKTVKEILNGYSKVGRLEPNKGDQAPGPSGVRLSDGKDKRRGIFSSGRASSAEEGRISRVTIEELDEYDSEKSQASALGAEKKDERTPPTNGPTITEVSDCSMKSSSGSTVCSSLLNGSSSSLSSGSSSGAKIKSSQLFSNYPLQKKLSMWICARCTLENPRWRLTCEACDMWRPTVCDYKLCKKTSDRPDENADGAITDSVSAEPRRSTPPLPLSGPADRGAEVLDRETTDLIRNGQILANLSSRRAPPRNGERENLIPQSSPKTGKTEVINGGGPSHGSGSHRENKDDASSGPLNEIFASSSKSSADFEQTEVVRKARLAFFNKADGKSDRLDASANTDLESVNNMDNVSKAAATEKLKLRELLKEMKDSLPKQRKLRNATPAVDPVDRSSEAPPDPPRHKPSIAKQNSFDENSITCTATKPFVNRERPVVRQESLQEHPLRNSVQTIQNSYKLETIAGVQSKVHTEVKQKSPTDGSVNGERSEGGAKAKTTVNGDSVGTNVAGVVRRAPLSGDDPNTGDRPEPAPRMRPSERAERLEKPKAETPPRKATTTPSTVESEGSTAPPNTTHDKPESQKKAEAVFIKSRTVIEEIKVRRKPEKVSSSAQTSAKVLPRQDSKGSSNSDEVLVPVTAEEYILNDDGSIASSSVRVQPTKVDVKKFELMRPRDFTSTKSNGEWDGLNSSNDFCRALPTPSTPSSSSSVPTGLNLPVQPPPRTTAGSTSPSLSPSPSPSTSKGDDYVSSVGTVALNRLLKRLETAISGGQHDAAAVLAKELAKLKVPCSVVRHSPSRSNPTDILMKVTIEDKSSQKGPMTMRVKPWVKLADLKNKIEKEHHVPPHLQRWFVDKKLASDDQANVRQMGIEGPATPVFLYFIHPDKEDEGSEDEGSKEDLRRRKILNTRAGLSEDVETPSSLTATLPSHQSLGWRCDRCQRNNRREEKTCSGCATAGPQRSSADVVQSDARPSGSNLATGSEDDPRHPPPPDPPAPSTSYQADEREKQENYQRLVDLEKDELVVSVVAFECPVCFVQCQPPDGVVLKECLHSFCKACLSKTVEYSEEAEVKCPFRDDSYTCDSTLLEREIKALVTAEVYEQHLAKSIAQAETKIENAFHCKTPDCKGWCIYEDNVNLFKCPVCLHSNCLTCQAIHEGLDCKQYQEQLNQESEVNLDAKRTKDMLQEMVDRGEAMPCPTCKVVLMKKWGCDWLRCSMCKTEICWVTRGPRWGPGGKGDTSGGCQCGVNGVKCHPKCNYCH